MVVLHVPPNFDPPPPFAPSPLPFVYPYTSAQAQAAYTSLISSVDELDGLASRGIREKGGLKDDKKILEVYGNCVERGSTLIGLLPASK